MTRAIAAFIAAIILLSAAPGWAQNSADEAEIAFRLGNTAYQAGKYQEAIGHYFRSNRLAPNPNVKFNIARCFEALKQYVEAYRYYSEFAAKAKDPKEVKIVKSSLARIKGRVAVVKIESQPTGASVFVGRVDLGEVARTPVTFPVEPKTQTIIVSLEGYKEERITLKLLPGDNSFASIKLEPILGTLRVEGTPQKDVEFRVGDFAVRGDIPGEVRLPIGEQLVEISAKSYSPFQRSVTLTTGENDPIQVALQPIVGRLVATSSENGAQVVVDGVVRGFTPAVIEVTVGTHEISVVKPGFKIATRNLSFEAGERVEFDVELLEATAVQAVSGVEEDIARAPASVSVVNIQEIDAFGYRGTADALRGTKGIYFTNDLTYRLIGVRGLSPFGQFGNRVLVQLDGHILNDSWIGASFHEFELLSDLYSLDRIEVVRGPNSVLYGSGAFQGVINLVSPDVRSFANRRVGATAVSDGVFRAYGHAVQPFKDGGALLSAGYVVGQPLGFNSDRRVGSAEFPDGRADNVGGFDAYTVRGKGEWKFLKLSGLYHARDQGVATGAYETLFGDNRTREADTRFFANVGGDFDLMDGFDVTVNGAFDGYRYEGDFPYDPVDGGVQGDRFTGLWGTLSSEAGWKIAHSTRLRFGLSVARHFENLAESANDDGPFFEQSSPFSQFSVFANARQGIGDWMELFGGARFDLWAYDQLPTLNGPDAQKTVSNVNPRLVAQFYPSSFDTIKVMGGRGFRAPSVYELSYNDDGQTQISNPEIDPETILSAEFEYQRLLGQFTAVAGMFYNRIDDVIAQSGGGDSSDPFIFDNTGQSLNSLGVEVELRRSFFQGWMFSVNYGFQRTEPGNLNDLWDDASFVNSPLHSAGIKFIAPIISPALKVSTRASILSSRIDREGASTSPSLLWDVAAFGKFAETPVHYTLRVDNVLDWKIEHPTGDEIEDPRTLQSPRTLVFDLSVRF